MSTQTWFIIAIVIYMVAMLLIGLWSYRQTDEYDDYMLAGMITGAVVSFAWGMTPALHGALYEIVPGVVSATIVMVVVSLLTKAPTEDVVEEFEQATAAAAA